MKTSNLSGHALDWAVAKCEGGNIQTQNGIFLNQGDGYNYFTPSTNWSQGGPIIEREEISIKDNGGISTYKYKWGASIGLYKSFGTTPLIAAMRCYVASKLGDEIDIPEELK